MTTKHFVTPDELDQAFAELETKVVMAQEDIQLGGRVTIYGVPRGGVPVALWFAGRYFGYTDSPADADIIVDDIWDSGKTAEKFEHYGKPFFALFDKREPQWAGKWLVMPWEATPDADHSADDIVTRLLEYIGEDPSREGLKETPARVLKAWQEWATGYGQDPKAILKTFEDGANGVDEMVIVHNIPVISKCEHHLADIIGVAHVGYVPNGKIVGLSKLPRLVDVFARRLQVQERLTNQIADALQEHLAPLGIGVVIRAAHHCMLTRGVKVHGSVTTTSAMRGVLRDKIEARAEFMALCQAAEKGQ